MSFSVSPEFIKAYSEQFTNLILAKTYAGKKTISGNDLIALTPVRQINLGILSRLSKVWEKAASQFESPFFDFAHEEVQAGLGAFMNILSRHISIRENDLRPFLREETENALLLLTDPARYIEKKIDWLGKDEFNAAIADTLVRQTQIHGGIAKALSLRLTDSGLKTVTSLQAKRWLAELLENGTVLDDIESHQAQFSEIQLLDLPKPQVPKPAPVSSSTGISFFDSVFNEATSDVPSKTQAPAPAPVPVFVPEIKPVVAETVRIAEPIIPATATPVKEHHPEPETPESKSINSRYKVEAPAVQPENVYGSVASRLETILGSLTIGDRYMFLGQLFNGNQDHLTDAFNRLDAAGNREAAIRIIEDELAVKHGWNLRGEAATELLTRVKRKYS